MMTAEMSPVAAGVRVTTSASYGDDGRWRPQNEVVIGRDEPVFAGHYPGFPVLPGVCVVECVRRSALSVLPSAIAAAALECVELARFHSAVLPGDMLRIALEWYAHDGVWRCAAQVHSPRAAAASVRLRFRAEPAL